ncbi:helix-turn-helix domain-containing protein [Ammoniphilus resinae]|uniref:Helix-turn-helix domain-containing protein n=1 Tax=Ammoniphilus resinae TaxID=861532 RepID=A0ABS4GNK1_9BACL|nr:helix-turn-helix domain-containing protein [Ammoniphilus resinae]MBP1931843.1 hypothetical protein [Ammoniphilus resinae]
MMYLSVRDVAERMSKSEETIKRWLRSGKFPNAYKVSDKEGWRIPESDFLNGQAISPPQPEQTSLFTPQQRSHSDDNDLIILAYQAVTLTTPTDELLELFTSIGIKRTLELLLVMQQSPTKVKNPLGFFKRAIKENWTPSTLPERVNRHRQNLEERLGYQSNNQSQPFPFYNWLEGDSN